MQFSERLNRITEPQTILMAKLGRELKEQGVDLVDLSLGEPDFPTPQHIIDAAKSALDAGFTKYPPVAGIPELRKAICAKFKKDNQLDYQMDEVMVSTGAKQALANVILSLINPGDEVIIPTPYWVTYAALTNLAQGKCVFVPCSIDEQFKISPDKLKAAISPKTKMFIFSSPCNPTGAVYTKDELAGLAKVFEQYPQIIIVSDEIYEYINYNGKHESIAQFDSIKDRVVVVNGFSKGFSMTGWRLGYMAAHPEIVKSCEKYQSQITSGANSMAQKAGITALTADLTPTIKMTEAFKERRNFFVQALSEIEGLKIDAPDGAFYAFPDISSFFGKSYKGKIIENADDLTMLILNEGHVTGVSGSAFGNDQCIRFSFATSMDNLKIAAERIKDILNKLENNL